MKKLVVLGVLAVIVATGCGQQDEPGKKLRIGVMPKLVGIDFFNAAPSRPPRNWAST